LISGTQAATPTDSICEQKQRTRGIELPPTAFAAADQVLFGKPG
jgi:hypothetical protein